MSQLLTSVLLNGVEVAGVSLVSWKCTPTFGFSIQECVIECAFNVLDSITALDSGVSIVISRGFTTASDEIVFSGFVDRVDKNSSTVSIYGKDKASILARTIVNYSYDGQSFSDEKKGSDIARDLIETWGKLSSSVVDTGDIILLKKFNCKYVDAMSRLQTLADIYDYQIYYNPTDDKVHFEPKGYVNNSLPIYNGGDNSNVTGQVKWVFDNSQCVNKILVRGAVQNTSTSELFNGGSSIVLQFNPITTEVAEYVDGSWVAKVFGVFGDGSYYDYSVDVTNKTINPSVNWIPTVGTNNVRVIYSYGLPADVILENKDSIATYGLYYSVKYFADVVTLADAEARGNHFLTQYSYPFVQANIQMAGLISYNVGDFVNVIDSVNSENRIVTVNQIEKSYPFNGDKLSVGDKQWRISDWGKMTADRIRRLEEENNSDVGVFITIIYLNHEIDIERTYLSVSSETVQADGFILDKTDYDVLDTDVLVDHPFDTAVTKWLVWVNDAYVEDFRSEDFKYSTNGDWNTSSRTLTHTGINNTYSKLVYTKNKTITGARMTVTYTSSTGTPTLYMSVDNVNWETVSSGADYTFSNVGTGLYWRVRTNQDFGLSTTFTEIKIDNITEA